MRYSLMLNGFLMMMMAIAAHVSAMPVLPVMPATMPAIPDIDLGEHHDDILASLFSSSSENIRSNPLVSLQTSSAQGSQASVPREPEKMLELQVGASSESTSSLVPIVVGVTIGVVVLAAVGILVGMAIHNVMWLRKQRKMRDSTR